MLTIELAVDPLLRGYRWDEPRGDSIWLNEYWDKEGVDAPDAKLSIDFRGLADISPSNWRLNSHLAHSLHLSMTSAARPSSKPNAEPPIRGSQLLSSSRTTGSRIVDQQSLRSLIFANCQSDNRLLAERGCCVAGPDWVKRSNPGQTLVRFSFVGQTDVPRSVPKNMPYKPGRNHLTRETHATRSRVLSISGNSFCYLLPDYTLNSTFSPPLRTVISMDRRTPYTLSVLAPSTDGADESRTQIQSKLREFVLEFQLDNAFIYRYAEKIRRAHCNANQTQGSITPKCSR